MEHIKPVLERVMGGIAKQYEKIVTVQTPGGNLVRIYPTEESANEAKLRGELAIGPAETKALADVNEIFPGSRVETMRNLKHENT